MRVRESHTRQGCWVCVVPALTPSAVYGAGAGTKPSAVYGAVQAGTDHRVESRLCLSDASALRVRQALLAARKGAGAVMCWAAYCRRGCVCACLPAHLLVLPEQHCI